MRVFLIHGMGRTPISMWWLSRRLRSAGHLPELFGYWVTRDDLETIAEAFLARVTRVLEEDRSHGRGGEYAIVGHSLGNIITRMISAELPAGFSRFMMLAPPNHSPVIARVLRKNLLFRLITRDAGQKLADDGFYDRLPVANVPSLVIAGTRGPRASWLPFAGERNDSIVGVEEARLDGVPMIEIPAVHTFLMNRGDVFSLLQEFLDKGEVPSTAATAAGSARIRRLTRSNSDDGPKRIPPAER